MIPALHILTDDEILTRDGFLSVACHVMEAGGEGVALHLRGPRTTGRVLYTLAQALMDPARTSGCILLVNDRVDLALALGLSGAHLGQRSIPPVAARRILGDHRLLGLSVHGVDEAEEANAGRVDFLFAGTIFPSTSHPERLPGGTARIGEIRGVAGIPILAIGGITRDRVAEAIGAGAHGVAVRGGIWDAEDPTAATRVYLDALKRGRRE